MASGGARVHVYGDWDGSGVKKAQQDISAFGKQADGFSGAFSKSMMGVGAALGGAFAVGSIVSTTVDFLKDAAAAAMEDEKSMVALATAMDNVGLASKNAAAEDFVKQLMLATGVADDQLRPALQRLVTATGDAERSQKLLGLALDVSTATGKDLTSVATALGKAANGQVSALTRLGVPLDANIVKTKDFTAAVDVMTQRFGGQAAAAADTYGGQLKRVQTAADEAKETIGYALLDAVQNATNAFGGSGGMVDVITMAGEQAADLVAGLGQITTGLAELIAGLQDTNVSLGGTSQSIWDMGVDIAKTLPMVGLQIQAFEDLTANGHEYRTSQERINESISASEALYAGYIASTDQATISQQEAEIAAADLADRLKEIKDQFTALTSAISTSQSLDDFKKSLADLDEKLKKNGYSFKGMGDAAKENRDTLRGAFSDAAKIAQQWAEDNGKSADEAKGYYDGLAKKIVKQFVDDGFKRSDVMAFLGNEGIWTGPAKDALDAAERAGLAKAYSGGKNIGRDLGRGMAAGIVDTTTLAGIQAASARATAAAEDAARAASKTHSPSLVWHKIGTDLLDGLIAGMDSKKDAVKNKAQETMQAISDKAGEMIAKWDDHLVNLKDKLDTAVSLFNDFKDQVSSGIFGQLDLGAAIDEAKKTGVSVVDAFQKQASGITAFAQNLIALTSTNLSQSAWTAVASLSADRGTDLTNAMLGAQGQSIIDGVNKIYSDVDAMATAVGVMAAQKWYGEGVSQAQATYEGFKANFGEGGPARKALMNLMDHLANAMNRTATVTVRTVYEAAGIAPGNARAAGGPVAFGQAYLVGEKGPEVFVPDSAGTIIPNGGLPTASGSYGSTGSSTYNITVQTGVGDPRQIGQQVVEYIKRFEAANGPVFVAA